MAKSFTYEVKDKATGIKKFDINARFTGRKGWTFEAPRFSLASVVCGNMENAKRVAGFIAGGLARNHEEGIDGMARANIAKVISVK